MVNATEQASKAGLQGTSSVLLDGDQLSGDTIEEMAQNLRSGIS